MDSAVYTVPTDTPEADSTLGAPTRPCLSLADERAARYRTS
ncbi:hypothetical protein [Streptomyces sp. NPDC054804]